MISIFSSEWYFYSSYFPHTDSMGSRELKASYGWGGLSLSGKFASFTLQNMLYFPKLTFEVNLLRVKTWLYIIWVYMQKIVSIGLAVNVWSKHKQTHTHTDRHTHTHFRIYISRDYSKSELPYIKLTLTPSYSGVNNPLFC